MHKPDSKAWEALARDPKKSHQLEYSVLDIRPSNGQSHDDAALHIIKKNQVLHRKKEKLFGYLNVCNC